MHACDDRQCTHHSDQLIVIVVGRVVAAGRGASDAGRIAGRRGAIVGDAEALQAGGDEVDVAGVRWAQYAVQQRHSSEEKLEEEGGGRSVLIGRQARQ